MSNVTGITIMFNGSARRYKRNLMIKRFFLKLLIYITAPFRWFRLNAVKYLVRLRAKLQIGSLKEAIKDADENKQKTGRKNMVVFNAHSGKYEPLQKKALKALANSSKNTSNKAMTEGRKKMLQQQKRRKKIIDSDRVKTIEEKSLYVTK